MGSTENSYEQYRFESYLLGCFKLTDKGFKKLTQIVMDLAKTHCDDRLLSILEGGYNIEGNALAILSHVQTLNNYN